MKKIYVMGGGTISHIRNHLALCAPAFGSTARDIATMCKLRFIMHPDREILSILTKMADPSGLFGNQREDIVTNDDVTTYLDAIKQDPHTKVIFFNIAMCDWTAQVAVAVDSNEIAIASGKYAKRLKTEEGHKMLLLSPAEKIIKTIRQDREDIFVVGFKTTCGASLAVQKTAGSKLLEASNINLVLVNDTRLRTNVIIAQEGIISTQTSDREKALLELVDTTFRRANL